MTHFKHILITRFNLVSNKLNWTKSQSCNQDKWMEHRWEIFTTYCLPSILNQSVKNFIWLIYFDEHTSLVFKEKIKSLAKKHSLIYPVFKPSYEAFLNELSDDILEFKIDETSHIITSRIDNDDCFHRDAIKIIQAQFLGQSFHLINLAKGITLKISPISQAAQYTYYSGPFVSLIEKINQGDVLKTVFDEDHNVYTKKNTVTQLESAVYWIQIIHNYNVSNNLRGRPISINIIDDIYGFKLIRSNIINYYVRLLKYHIFSFPVIRLKNLIKNILGYPISYK